MLQRNSEFLNILLQNGIVAFFSCLFPLILLSLFPTASIIDTLIGAPLGAMVGVGIHYYLPKVFRINLDLSQGDMKTKYLIAIGIQLLLPIAILAFTSYMIAVKLQLYVLMVGCLGYLVLRLDKLEGKFRETGDAPGISSALALFYYIMPILFIGSDNYFYQEFPIHWYTAIFLIPIGLFAWGCGCFSAYLSSKILFEIWTDKFED